MKPIISLFILLFVVCLSYGQGPYIKWAQAFGGVSATTPSIGGKAISLDDSGSVYTAGIITTSTDFYSSTTSARYFLGVSGFNDVYVYKKDRDGRFVWAKSFRGTGNSEQVVDIEVDRKHNVYTLGMFDDSCDFDPDSNSTFILGAGPYNGDVFLSKLNDTAGFVWAKQINRNSGYLDVGGMEFDPNNKLLVVGHFSEPVDFNPDTAKNIFTHTGGGLDYDGFISIYDTNGVQLQTQILRGDSNQSILDIAISDSGHIYLTGLFIDSTDFDFGPGVYHYSTGNRYWGAYVAKYDSSLNLLWVNSIQFGGERFSIEKLDVSQLGQVSIVGSFRDSIRFEPNVSSWNNSNGFEDFFVATFRANGSFHWAHRIGGSRADEAKGVHFLNNNSLIVTGKFTDSVDFDPGPNHAMVIGKGWSQYKANAFLASFDSTGDLSWVHPFGFDVSNGDYGQDICSDANGDILLTGSLVSGNSDINPYWGEYRAGVLFGRASLIKKMGICTVLPDSIDTNVCDSFRYGPHSWFSSGTYNDTVLGPEGCHVLMNLVLQVDSSTYDSVLVNDHFSYVLPSNRDTLFTSGWVLDTIATAAGCDSVMALNVRLDSSTFFTYNLNACDSVVSPSGKFIWTATGTYMDTLSNRYSKDSILTVNLSLNFSSSSNRQIAACGPYTSPSSKYVWDSTGIYYDTISISNGCFGFITVNLTIGRRDSSNSPLQLASCDTILSPSGKHTYTHSGVYYDTFINSTGCDSILKIVAQIDPPDTSLRHRGDSLIGSSFNNSFHWYTCDSGFVLIPGANDSVYKVKGNGKYAAIVGRLHCSDTTACIMVSGLGLGTEAALDPVFLIFPNPSSGRLVVLSNRKGIYTIRIKDMLGKLKYSETGYIFERKQLSLSLEKASYIMEIEDSLGSIYRQSIIIFD